MLRHQFKPKYRPPTTAHKPRAHPRANQRRRAVAVPPQSDPVGPKLPENKNQPILLTVANYGYLDMLLNFCHTLQSVAPHRLSDLIIMTYDKRLVDALKCYSCLTVQLVDYTKHLPYLSQPSALSSNSVDFKVGDWNAITRFKLLAIWKLLDQGYPVLYCDPDIAFVKDPLQVLPDDQKTWLQKGRPYCSGVIFTKPGVTATALFHPDQWTQSHLDDENYLKQRIEKLHNNQVSILDFADFPNGLMWKNNVSGVQQAKDAIAKKECILFHFNFISGAKAKIARMRECDAFIPTLKLVDVPGFTNAVSLRELCLKRKGSAYPPHHTGDHLEEHCERLIRERMSKQLVRSAYWYLPIGWTTLAVDANPDTLKRLQDWCKKLFSNHPDRQFCTVVQHCKGIAGSTGVELPKSCLLFRTTEPDTNPMPRPKRPPIKRINPKTGRFVYQQQPEAPVITDNVNRAVTISLVSSPHVTAKPADKTLLASFMGSQSVHPIRLKLAEAFVGDKRVSIKSGDYRTNEDAKEFESLMGQSLFALCPRGFGSTSFRLSEAMEFGCIPVYISDNFSRPFADKFKLEDVCVMIDATQISELPQQLREIASDEKKIKQYRENIAQHRRYFTLSGCCQTIIDDYIIHPA